MSLKGRRPVGVEWISAMGMGCKKKSGSPPKRTPSFKVIPIKKHPGGTNSSAWQVNRPLDRRWVQNFALSSFTIDSSGSDQAAASIRRPGRGGALKDESLVSSCLQYISVYIAKTRMMNQMFRLPCTPLSSPLNNT